MNFPQLTSNIITTHEILQNDTIRAINKNITNRNWLIGLWIVEFEQNGEDRAKYGDKLLHNIAKAISIRGLGSTNLSQCSKFYLIYPNIGFEIKKYLSNYTKIFQSATEKLQISDNEVIIKAIIALFNFLRFSTFIFFFFLHLRKMSFHIIY